MWEIARVRVTEPEKVEGYLAQGYEPFAVTVDKWDIEAVWLKREIQASQRLAYLAHNIIEGEYTEVKESTNEPQKPRKEKRVVKRKRGAPKGV